MTSESPSFLFRVTRLRLIPFIPSSYTLHPFTHLSPIHFFLRAPSPFALFPRFLPGPFVMNLIQIYAVAAGGIFSLFALVRLLPSVIPFSTRVSWFVSKHLTYPYLLHRHQILGPWTRAGVAMQLAYLATNVFCVSVVEISWDGLRVSTFADAGRRASVLAMVNMVPALAGFHHAFLADQLGLSVKTIRGIHRSAGWMMCGLLLLHAMVAASQESLPLNVPQNLFAVVVRFIRSPFR
jgi:hypothetical protein